MQAAAGLGSSLLELGKFVQLQPTCISACAHRPAGACASAALQRDDSADLIRVLIRPFTDVEQPGDCGPRGGGRTNGPNTVPQKSQDSCAQDPSVPEQILGIRQHVLLTFDLP